MKKPIGFPSVLNELTQIYVEFRKVEKRYNKSRVNFFRKTDYNGFMKELETLSDVLDQCEQRYKKEKKNGEVPDMNKEVLKTITGRFQLLSVTMNSLQVYLSFIELGRSQSAPHKVLYLRNSQQLNENSKRFLDVIRKYYK